MPTALEYFEKCAGARGENYLMGGTGFGVGADLAAHNSGVELDQVDPQAMAQARHRGRAIEAVGALSLGALGGLGLAAYHHPMGEWFDTGDHAGSTLHDMGTGAAAGSIVGSYAAPAISGYHGVSKLVEEAKRRRATGNQAPDLPPVSPLRANSTEGIIGGEAVPQT